MTRPIVAMIFLLSLVCAGLIFALFIKDGLGDEWSEIPDGGRVLVAWTGNGQDKKTFKLENPAVLEWISMNSQSLAPWETTCIISTDKEELSGVSDRSERSTSKRRDSFFLKEPGEHWVTFTIDGPWKARVVEYPLEEADKAIPAKKNFAERRLRNMAPP